MTPQITLEGVLVVECVKDKDGVRYRCDLGGKEKWISSELLFLSRPEDPLEELRPGVVYELDVSKIWAKREGLIP